MKKQVQSPVTTPTAGTYSEDISVTINCPTDGAQIYYTTDGSDPDASSTPYTTGIPVSGNGTVRTIKAIAVLDGMNDSSILTAEFTIDYAQVSTPQFSPVANTYDHDINVTISSLTADVDIYYTTNGDAPTILSTPYTTAGIPVEGHGTHMTIRAIAVKAGMEDSTEGSAEYTITYPTVATPTFTPEAGTYDHNISVEINCTESDVTIYYTTNGSTPTTSSATYSAGIPVTGHGTVMTINAIAVKDGMVQSEMASGEFTINYATVSTPNFNIAMTDTYNQDLDITITCSTSDAVIRYTTDGSTPDETSDVYSSSIPVHGHGTVMTINAIAYKSGMLHSTMEGYTYTIQYDRVATPTITTPGNVTNLFRNEAIYLNCTTAGVTMYYTTNGDDPTTSSTLYTTSIPASGLSASTTIKAIAVKSGMLDSALASKTYVIEQRDFYVSGYSGSAGPFYTDKYFGGTWPLDQTSTNAKAYRLVVSGTDVYTAGYYWNGARKVACYWKHLTLTNLTDTNNAEAKAIVVSGTTVYTAGSRNPETSTSQACYWIDATQYPITTSNKSQGNGIAVSGTDVYVAGWNQDASANQIACVWINDTKYDLSVPAAATSSEATDIVIYGGNVYIAGQYYNGNYCTCYWVNGTRTDLATGGTAYATKIAVSGSDVYVAGEYNSSSCYWLNNTAGITSLDYDRAEGISVVGSDVYVVESWYASGHNYIVLTKNGSTYRVYNGGNGIPTSIYVVP